MKWLLSISLFLSACSHTGNTTHRRSYVISKSHHFPQDSLYKEPPQAQSEDSEED